MASIISTFSLCGSLVLTGGEESSRQPLL